MLDMHKPPPSSDTKTYFSHSLLPTYIDPANTSTKKKPFTTFRAQPYTHTLDLVLAPETWALVRPRLRPLTRLVYARAHLRLSDVLDEEFLDAYVRNGSAVLLSKGRPDADTRFDVRDGVLTIEMPRHVYESAGLVGVPVEEGGRKHQGMRWRVELDLKTGSMRKGKKGFERLRWAAREVLGESRRCVFWTGNPSFGESVGAGREVLSRHAPEVVGLEPRVVEMAGVAVPGLNVPGNGLSGLYDQEDALALLEWLDMLSLGSPRVKDGSDVNSHLCRYDVPEFGHGVDTRDLVRVRWSGFITPVFVKDLFLEVWKAGYKGKRDPKKRKGDEEGDVTMDGTQDDADAGAWFSMNAQASGGKNAWSLMQFANRETLVWEVQG